MDKYGVDAPPPVEKTAEEKPLIVRCHKCGAVVEQVGNTLKCPNCGTEPFERP